MRITIAGRTFEGQHGDELIPPVVELVEGQLAWNDPKLAPLMAALRGAKLGQLPELLDRYGVPYQES